MVESAKSFHLWKEYKNIEKRIFTISPSQAHKHRLCIDCVMMYALKTSCCAVTACLNVKLNITNIVSFLTLFFYVLLFAVCFRCHSSTSTGKSDRCQLYFHSVMVFS